VENSVSGIAIETTPALSLGFRFQFDFQGYARSVPSDVERLDYDTSIASVGELLAGLAGVMSVLDPVEEQERDTYWAFLETHGAHATIVRRLQLGSPFEVLLVVPPLAAAAVPSVALLFYGIKRVFGLDLELRIHRAKLRAELAKAQRLAREAEAEEDRAHEEGASGAEPGQRAVAVIVSTSQEEAAAVDELLQELWVSPGLQRWQAEEATITDSETADEL
jgi:hypothetical protein